MKQAAAGGHPGGTVAGAQHMGRQRATFSRLFNAARPNPTIETLTNLLRALGVTAEVRLRPSHEGEAQIKIEVPTPA